MSFQDIENWSDTKRLIIGIPLMVVVFCMLYIAVDLEKPSRTPPESKEAAEKELDISEVYLKSHISSLLVFKDEGLMDFAVELNETCPYYEPDGTTYRNCIVGLTKEGEKKFSNSFTGKLEEYKKYCSDGALEMADEGSHGYTDTYNTCLLYKLRLATYCQGDILPDGPRVILDL